MNSIRFSCPNCHQTIKAAQSHVGRRARCPSCKLPIVVPAENQLRPTSDEFTLAAMSLAGDTNIEDFDSDIASLSGPKNRSPPESALPELMERAELDSSGSRTIDRNGYPALKRASLAFRLIAGATLIVWVLLLSTTLLGLDIPKTTPSDSGAPPQPNSILSFGFAFRFLGGASLICALLTASELIKVIIDIQDNTFAARRRR